MVKFYKVFYHGDLIGIVMDHEQILIDVIRDLNVEIEVAEIEPTANADDIQACDLVVFGHGGRCPKTNEVIIVRDKRWPREGEK